MKKLLLSFLLAILGVGMASAETDALTATHTASASYGDFTVTGTSGVEYNFGQVNKAVNGKLYYYQARKSKSSFIANNSALNGKVLKSISVDFTSTTDANAGTFDVYAANTAYSAYAAEPAGTKIGSMDGTGTKSVTFPENADYTYFIIVNNGTGIAKFTGISVEWGEPTSTLEDPELAFAKTSFDFDCGVAEKFYGPAATTNSDATISYTVVPEATASIDGTVVTITKPGTYTVTASVIATETYAAKTAEYTINAFDSLNYPGGSDTFVFTNNAYGMTPVASGNDYPNVGSTFPLNDNVSLTVGNNCRLYGSEGSYTFRLGKGQSSTISVAEGYEITAITANGGNPTVGETPAQSVTITNSTTGTMSLSSITVTYTNGSSITQTITVGESGMGTFCTKNALDFSEVTDVEAYVVTEIGADAVTITKVEGTVAGNTGLIITGTTANVPVVETGTTPATNYLMPAFDGFTIPASAAGTNRYVFGKLKGETESAFHMLATDYVSTGNHAYIQATSGSFAPTRLNIVKDGTESIQSVSVDADNDGAIYNAQGQRVDASYKGIVIKNGKKYINK